MAEYWKSTPTYWCKFCRQYVKDTSIERKNHDASAKHQNNIQRSLRELHKGREREEREKRRAREEVARLNGLVGGKGGVGGGGIQGARSVAAGEAPKLSEAAQRKAHAEQLAALGVQLPEAMKKDVTGVGGWQMVSERVVEEDAAAGRSLAGIVKREGVGEEDAKDGGGLSTGVRKRKVEDGEEGEDGAEIKRNAWGSRLKSYPGEDGGGEEEGDLEALLSGVGAKNVKEDEPAEEGDGVKEEEPPEDDNPISAIPDIDAPLAPMKKEDGEDAAPPVVFKKRKVKR